MATFADLPTEVRLMIFKYLFSTHQKFARLKTESVEHMRIMERPGVYKTVRSLQNNLRIFDVPAFCAPLALKVCRQWYIEAAPLYYASLKWRLIHRKTTHAADRVTKDQDRVWSADGFKILGARIGLHRLRTITYVEMDLFCVLENQALFDYMAPNDKRGVLNHSFDIREEDLKPMSAAFKESLPGLRHLVISPLSFRGDLSICRTHEVRDRWNSLLVTRVYLKRMVKDWIESLNELMQVEVYDIPPYDGTPAEVHNKEFHEFVQALLAEKKEIKAQK